MLWACYTAKRFLAAESQDQIQLPAQLTSDGSVLTAMERYHKTVIFKEAEKYFSKMAHRLKLDETGLLKWIRMTAFWQL